MNRFVPMYDLESLNEDQRQQYYLDACSFYGVPSELNLLAFIYMDSGDGAKNLVLYAKKGATDRIRDTRGITTTDLIGPVAIGGSVVFTAVGQNKDGRVERAVGAAAVEGLHGQNLAKAIMTAQTRATRRMTLQFVGGLLDESEVHNATANITQAEMPLSQLAAQAPAPVPNNAPGKETFPNFSELAVKVTDPIVLAAAEQLAKEEAAKLDYEMAVMMPTQNPPIEGVSLQEITPPRRRKREKSTNADIPESQSSFTVYRIKTPPPSLPCLDDSLKHLVTIASQATPSGPRVPPEVPKVVPSEPITAPQPASPAVDAKPVEPPVVDLPKADMPTVDQQKAYRARWSEYVNKRLSKEGKMVPTEGIGGVSTKLRKFVKHLLPETYESEALTVRQWEAILNYLDDKYEADGAEGLVKFIDGVVK